MNREHAHVARSQWKSRKCEVCRADFLAGNSRRVLCGSIPKKQGCTYKKYVLWWQERNRKETEQVKTAGERRRKRNPRSPEGVAQIPLSAGKFALVDDEDYESLSQFIWSFNGREAARRGQGALGEKHGKHIRMHRVLMNAPSDKFVDHINGNPLDNRKANLRLCTNAENCRNKKLDVRNTSGFRGVSWYPRNGKWISAIKHAGGVKFLGYFDDKMEAAKVWDAMAIKLHGEFARLNFSQV